jgi:LmbE family N-acetylglucosaminyl deacetylase
MARVLVVVSHRDDETLGLGGAIARHVASGDTVAAISMTDGVSARANGSLEQESRARLEASMAAAEILGFEWLGSASFPDNKMDAVALLDVVKFIEAIKQEFAPELLYTHFPGDLNIDHALTARAAFTAFRPEHSSVLKEIRTFEVPSATDYGTVIGNTFAPHLFIDVSRFWETKKRALRAYETELRNPPHSRSLEGIEALASLRGHQNCLGLAEAFQVHRKLEV